MRTITLLFVAAPSLLFVFARTPLDRTITDPASLTSARNADARPIPVEDLFFSRNITDPAWSPDGREVVFTTNLTGRMNLWKVASRGGWPLQLAVSDDRQFSNVYSPDGKWIAWQQDRGGNEAWDVYLVAANGGAPVNLTGTADFS